MSAILLHSSVNDIIRQHSSSLILLQKEDNVLARAWLVSIWFASWSNPTNPTKNGRPKSI